MSGQPSSERWIPGLPAKLGVMLSGSGRTLMNLLDAIAQGKLSARVVGVIASRECLGAERARQAGLATFVLKGQIPASELDQALAGIGAELVALCGYLKKLEVPERWRGRIVNIHPSLLPKFGGKGMYGDRVHAAVIEARETVSGCTVHLVDGEYDRGAILLQRTCPVLPEDDAQALAARVFEHECAAYPAALEQFIRDHVQQ